MIRSKFGDQRIVIIQFDSVLAGKATSEIDEEIFSIAVIIGHAFDELDFVVDAFEDVGIELVTGAGAQPSRTFPLASPDAPCCRAHHGSPASRHCGAITL